MASLDLRLLVSSDINAARAQVNSLFDSIDQRANASATKQIALTEKQIALERIRAAMVAGGYTSVGQLAKANPTAAYGNYYMPGGPPPAGTDPFASLAGGADKASNAIRGIGTASGVAGRGLQFFLLYRGFAVLEQGAHAVVTELVGLDHEVSLIMAKLPNFGAGMRGALTKEIEDTATKVGSSFQDVAEGMRAIAGAGGSADQMKVALESSAKMAQVTGTDTKTAFDIAKGAMESFGMGMGDVNSIFDRQAALVRNGIITFDQLASVGARVYESFAAAGGTFDQANAAMATISQTFTGPQFTRAATGLQSIMDTIAQSPDKWNAVIGNVEGLDGKIRPLPSLMLDVNTALDKMSGPEKAKALKQLFPTRQELMVYESLHDHLDTLNEDIANQAQAAGTLNKQWGVTSHDTQDNLQRIKDAAISGLQPVGNAVGVIAHAFVDLNDFMGGTFVPMLEGVTLYLGGVAAANYLLAKSAAAAGAAALAEGDQIAAGAATAGAGVAGAAGGLLRIAAPAIAIAEGAKIQSNAMDQATQAKLGDPMYKLFQEHQSNDFVHRIMRGDWSALNPFSSPSKMLFGTDVGGGGSTTQQGTPTSSSTPPYEKGAPSKPGVFTMPGLVGLDTELDNAAKAIRYGITDSRSGLPKLFDSFGMTASQLDSMSSAVGEFNALVTGEQVFESLKKLGSDIGVSTDALTAAEMEFAKNTTVAGKSLYSLLTQGDTATVLAKMAGEMKFGDIKVDQSTKQNIVIRIEGGTGTGNLEADARLADMVIAKLNNQMQRAVAH